MILISSYHDFPGFYIVAVNEAQNIYACLHSLHWDASRAPVNWNDDAPRHVNHLNRSLAVDDDVAVADENEIPIVTICVPANGKHQAESRSIIRRLSIEGITRRGQKVDVVPCHVINKVEIIHFYRFRVDGDGQIMLNWKIANTFRYYLIRCSQRFKNRS